MRGEAIYYGGIPMGLISLLSVNAISNHRKMGIMGKVISISFGIMGYNLGRFTYAGTCARKYVPEFSELMRAKLNAMSREKDHNMENIESNTLWSDDQATSSNYDASFDNDSNKFSDDNSDISNDTLGIEKPINLKQHVTYEELRKQNRGHYYGQMPYYQSQQPVKQKKSAEDTELLEDDSNFNMENMR
ncbi:uncharacterized protein LOC144472417 isoform X2 [Augochlora pura]